MAALVVVKFDLATFKEQLATRLPDYAQPLFCADRTGHRADRNLQAAQSRSWARGGCIAKKVNNTLYFEDRQRADLCAFG